MIGLKLLLQNEAVTGYLVAHPRLQNGGTVPEAVMLLRNNTSAGRCAVALHVVIDGRDHLVKLTLDMWQTIAEVSRSMAVELYGEERAP
jgi:hypothetical protein